MSRNADLARWLPSGSPSRGDVIAVTNTGPTQTAFVRMSAGGGGGGGGAPVPTAKGQILESDNAPRGGFQWTLESLDQGRY